ncbi:putative peptidyl-prolyl cis-trans isomerase [Aspergillus campestris IBT 28561]|uniref:Peptidyl-prolyl cis-trans isomerase-like 1 n=1 Tax=Aspergillus campestris (strain IBT 28561) TaxID=1392248 RepID=A0A2I1D496_ASPC2|nr:putative peptidyl-prolyl cis-trans isomerase [Aspergillus campestris IBT 28561]PKY04690.1 putative peptidyl-prolyl cis-trans isomerase [Aspergillus campestris IBT 28561]
MAAEEERSQPLSHKRPHAAVDGAEDNDDDSSDDDFGPALPSADAPKKKRRKLPFENVYVKALPASARYSKSLMHKDQLCYVTVTPHTDFLITSSIDGVVKFWKKTSEGLEFVKEFRAHTGEVKGVSVSADGRSFATTGTDKTIKIFDVITFDLLAMIPLDFVPRYVCWVHPRGASLPLVAVTDDETSTIRVYDGRGENHSPLHTVKSIHRTPVAAIAFNDAYDCAISADESGMIEYWRASDGSFEKPDNVFELKSSTNLFEFKKAKSTPASLTVSPSGEQFATVSFPDRQVRVFDFATGKLYRKYDESLSTITDMQQAGTAIYPLDEVEFGRRLAVERELENPVTQPRINVLFDESGHFIMYGSLYGIKCINTYTNRVVRVYARDEPFRGLNLAVYQGQPQKKGFMTVSMAASANPLLQEAEERDPFLVSTGFGKVRFYIFNNETEISKSSRDVQNERPTQAASGGETATQKAKETGTSAILHTTMGDIHLRLFPSAAPKAVENFVTHARHGYYNNTIFHRVIRKFMIQGGDPLGDGTGGESIWGGEFPDEFSTLKHDKPYTLSMANAGPNTNGSQFFITTEKTPWLDGKHTIFGRAVQGLDVVHKIENARTLKDREKPEVDIKIVSITVN